MNACDQHARLDRLDDVVIRAELEADDVVDVVVARGDDEDRQIRGGAQLLAHGEAVAARQPEVEHHEVRHFALQVLDDAIAAVLDGDPEAVALQISAHQLCEAQIVFDQQDEGRRCSSRSR